MIRNLKKNQNNSFNFQVQGLQGTVFRYDFSEMGTTNPSASGEPLSPRFETTYVNLHSPCGKFEYLMLIPK